ncbi:MAG TPA: hypothetical protein VKR38_10400 [Usitatibacter sp.]|nr:hypothetical protein [Usitatibacter sp.]
MHIVDRAILVAFTFAAASVLAQQYAFPAKGQSADQQKKDEAACGSWATDQTKYDPANPPQAPAAQQAPVTGSGARARGAAAGAIIGGATGGDAGDSAVAGAVAGGVVQRNRNRQAAAQQNQANAAQQQAGQDAYFKARGACLEGKGYTVK